MMIDDNEIVIDFAEEAEKAQIAAIMQSTAGVHAIQAELNRPGLGVCIECGDTIPKARRVAYPSARTCISCQELLEPRR